MIFREAVNLQARQELPNHISIFDAGNGPYTTVARRTVPDVDAKHPL
jgi:hypothetical protein